MKLLSTLFLSFFFCAILTAQYGLDPQVFRVETDGEDVDVKLYVTNNTGEFANIYWMYEKGENYPKDWGTTICDDTLCYAKNRYKSSPNLPNPMEPNYTFYFKVTISAGGVAGSSYAIMHLYDDPECENEVATSSPPSLSVSENELQRLAVFPNPTQDYFSISNDENVKSIDVINNVGQILMSASHEKNETHSIEKFESGVFIVVLKDSDNEIIKSLYLSKN